MFLYILYTINNSYEYFTFKHLGSELGSHLSKGLMLPLGTRIPEE